MLRSMEVEQIAVPLRHARGERALEVAGRVARSTWTLGAIVFCLTWGGALVSPYAFGLDISAYAGLDIAAREGLDFGSDVIFTYGPLGFLKTYLAFDETTARMAALYGILLHLSLSVSLVYAARRSFPLPVALLAALVAALLLRGNLAADAVRTDGAIVVLALIWSVAALRTGAPPWTRRLLLLAGGPFAAIEILAKLNTGLIVLALIAIAAAAMEGDRRRNLGLLAVTFAPSLVVLWFATGHGLGDIGPYLSGMREIVSGYSSGARLEWETRDYDYLLAPAAIAAAAGIAWASTRELSPGRRIAAGAMLALVAYTAFKAGFVSHDEFHMATFFSTMLGACLAFGLPARRRVRIGAGIAIAGVAVAGFTPAFEGYPMTNPLENVRNGASTVAALVEPGELTERIASSRAEMIADYGLDRRTLELLEGSSVHVDPAEVGVVWAHELDWRPLPVYQPYVAWTEELDRRNAEALGSARAPERILRRAANPLGRFPGFESPAAMIEMLCRYELLRAQGEWQVLGRVPNRCGPPRPIGSAEGTYGEPIPVPKAAPDDLVFARVDGVQVSGLERLEALLHRAEARQVSFDGGRPYVFIPAAAENGLILRAPAAIDYPGEFALAPNAEALTFLLDGEPAEQEIRAEFYAMRATEDR
jgi:hypothetical protein